MEASISDTRPKIATMPRGATPATVAPTQTLDLGELGHINPRKFGVRSQFEPVNAVRNPDACVRYPEVATQNGGRPSHSMERQMPPDRFSESPPYPRHSALTTSPFQD
jgi:hypothetical protein